MLTVDASPGFPPISLVNRLYATVESTRKSLPIIDGVPKSAKERTNASSAPVLIAGKINGRVTCMNLEKGG